MKNFSQLSACMSAMVLALFVVACHQSSATGNQANGSAEKVASNSLAATPEVQTSTNAEEKIPRIKAQDAIKEVADGKSIVIDVRGTEAYKMAHIKGALDIPLQKLESKDFDGLPKDKKMITYCT
jgi:predicted sulfurtransferase